METPDRRIFIAAVVLKTGLHSTTIWRQCRAGEFPQPLYIGNRRSWLESEIDAWIAAQAARKPEERRGAANLKKGRAA